MSRDGCPRAAEGIPRGARQVARVMRPMRISCVKMSSRFLLASICSLALLGGSARAELRANDPHVRAALEDFERYAAKPKPVSDTRDKEPLTLAAMIGDFFRGGAAVVDPKGVSD